MNCNEDLKAELNRENAALQLGYKEKIRIRTEAVSQVADSLKNYTFIQSQSSPGFICSTTRVSQEDARGFFVGLETLGIDFNTACGAVYELSGGVLDGVRDQQGAMIGSKGELAIHESITSQLQRLGLKLNQTSTQPSQLR